MKYLLLILLLITTKVTFSQNSIDIGITNKTRSSCVKIISKIGNSSGTGFFISDDLIVTCFHVIAKYYSDNSGRVEFNIFSDIQAVNEYGDTTSLTCISIPNQTSFEPLISDFAILKVSKRTLNHTVLELAKYNSNDIADQVIFTGYPLGTPTMVSHFGTISGVTKDKSIICVQASTNKGNSGGALVNKDGRVIGIVSMREGGIGLGLSNYLNQITQSEKEGSIQLMGIDPLQVTKQTIMILDNYISTGIGYARNVKFLSEYIQKYNIKIQ